MLCKNTISLCMIVRDEQKYLKYSLESVKNYVDEIIIVDTGSEDNSIEIAKKYTDKIIKTPMIKDFGRVRQLSVSLATSTHILWLDADEIILKCEAKKLRELINDTTCDFFSFSRYNFWKGFNSIFNYPDKQLKLYRNLDNFKWSGTLHEKVIDIYGNDLRIKDSGLYTYHFAYMKSKTEIEKKLMFYYSIIHPQYTEEQRKMLVRKHGFFNKKNEARLQKIEIPKDLLEIFK